MPVPQRNFDFAGLKDRIKVGYRWITIRIMGDWESDGSSEYGAIDMAKGEIRLCAFMDRLKAAETLLHEITHVIFFTWDLDRGRHHRHTDVQELTEEEITIKVSFGLSTVAVDNPWLFPLLQGWLSAGEE